MAANQSLISTISNTSNPNPVRLKEMVWRGEATVTAALRAAAVLTCWPKGGKPADAVLTRQGATEGRG